MDIEDSFVFCVHVNEYITKKLKTVSSLMINLAIYRSKKTTFEGHNELMRPLVRALIFWTST